jgi:outer membrane protein assembly factor BamB
MNRRMRALTLFASVVAAAVCVAIFAPPTSAAGFINWPGYLYGPNHSSFSPATAITPLNASALKRKWTLRPPGPTAGQPPAGFIASPTVYNGVIYIGYNTGVFYAINETNGAILWSQNLGFVSMKTCAARGISSTATVAIDPGTQKPAVYVAGGDGNLYSLDAATGSIVWQSVIALPSPTQNDYYDWSSPAVAGGIVYIGVSSQCDKPLVSNGGLRAYNQATGAPVAAYLDMPAGVVGGSIWSSPDVGFAGDVFVTTGNTSPKVLQKGDSSSLVSLNPTTLAKQGSWSIPPTVQVEDNDWAASPVSFMATLNGTPTEMVGACNKNGFFYALNAHNISAGPVWSFQVGLGTGNGVQSCLGATIWDGSFLYQPGNQTTINSISFFGSMRKMDPSTGTPVWQTGLNGIVLGSPSLNASGVIAAATYGPTTVSGTYLINASTGAILRFIQVGKEFSQPVFADGLLLLATQGGGINAYGP